MLSGDGADELFGGYQRSYYAYLSALYDQKEFEIFERAISAAQDFLGMNIKSIYEEWQVSHAFCKAKRFHQHNEVSSGLLGPAFEGQFSSIFEETWQNSYPVSSGGVFFDNLLTHLKQRYLPLILRIEDRISSAYSIETRVPFLDHKLAELVEI